MGKVADTLEGLDYSETAYETAKMRLQRKFGGPRRQVQNQIEKLRSMKPLHVDIVEDLERFSDALEKVVVLLQTQGKLSELQPNSSLYTMSLEKIPEEMLFRYYRWLGERCKPETLEVFKDWMMDETDYRVKAGEAIKGLKPSKRRFEAHLGMVKQADQNNYTMALKRLENTELKLLKNLEMAQDYQATITSYLQQGYIRKLPDDEMKQVSGWLLPHFPVFRPERQTTKTRIVFDASAKHKGVSLNDEILPGPKLQNDLMDILLQFRRNPIALVADISQMYLRNRIAPPDRRYFRFLWRDLDMKRKPEVYKCERVVFGKKSAPFEAQFTIQEDARKHQNQFPAAAETVLESTYMDDSMDSTVDEQNAIDLYRQLSELWERAGMHARKWLSNSTHVLKEVPQEDRLSKVDFNHEDLPSTKTLGVVWIAEADVFTFKTKPPETDLPLTKRNVLKNVATLFDPLGLVRAKILLQVMWTRRLDWDEDIDGDLTEQVQQWFSKLEDLRNLQVHRCLQPGTGSAETPIHTFVDASKDAFGAVSYVRNVRRDEVVETRFIASKTKVAPLATMSIPRLELSAAVMGLRLSQSVSKVLQMAIGRTIFWSESTNTLWWIRGNGRCFKPFVANRIGEIQA